MSIWDGFEQKCAPETGRKILQLTAGDATCYPLYYFIPTFTRDSRRLIYHKAQEDEVQVHVLDLVSGESLQLTHGSAQQTEWIPWCVDSGTGVLDHRSVLDIKAERLIYFDGNEVRCVDLDATNDRLLFSLSDDRVAIGQNCMSSGGDWFVYIHHDRDLFARIYPDGNRSLSKGTVLAAYNLKTGEHRDLVIINSPIHHVLPLGRDAFIFCHPATESGMLLTDLNGGWYAHLRTQDEAGGTVCHYVATRRGIAYEVLGREDTVLAGLYHPASHRRYEFALPSEFGYTHTGRDPEGTLWFFENKSDVHDLRFLARHDPAGQDQWTRLTGDWPTYGGGQKAHFHPQVSPDRKWILMTGGAPETETNHLFLVDIADLDDTQGIPTLDS